jgi:ketosteroid isomerase-like protein
MADKEVRAWLDRLAIQDLVGRYADGITRGDWPQVEATFAPDAVWETSVGLKFDSAAAFLDFVRTGEFDLMNQTPHATVVTLTGGDSATATTTIHELTRGVTKVDSPFGPAGATLNLDQYGVYYDTFGRVNGEWTFTHRKFVPLYATPESVNGFVITPRSELLPGGTS